LPVSSRKPSPFIEVPCYRENVVTPPSFFTPMTPCCYSESPSPGSCPAAFPVFPWCSSHRWRYTKAPDSPVVAALPRAPVRGDQRGSTHCAAPPGLPQPLSSPGWATVIVGPLAPWAAGPRSAGALGQESTCHYSSIFNIRISIIPLFISRNSFKIQKLIINWIQLRKIQSKFL
jgi:hypothetical protein